MTLYTLTHAEEIQKKALSLGFAKCGIIHADAVAGYEERLDERIQKVPESASMYNNFRRYADTRQAFPWVKSLVVVVWEYRKYKSPGDLRGRIGLSYQFDSRINPAAEGFQKRDELAAFMEGLGLAVGREERFGFTAVRYAAAMAGLGVIRNNNFFYTENGSWNNIFVFAIDEELELIETPKTKNCPDNCNRCIGACPTRSLNEPFTMNPHKCISFLTSRGGETVSLAGKPIGKLLGNWIYGCDICQDVCPFNKGRLTNETNFPGLDHIAANFSPEQIVDMDEDFYENEISRKFWYLDENKSWVWKVNALNAMINAFEPKYEPYIRSCLHDPSEKVREMAAWACETLGLRTE